MHGRVRLIRTLDSIGVRAGLRAAAPPPPEVICYGTTRPKSMQDKVGSYIRRIEDDPFSAIYWRKRLPQLAPSMLARLLSSGILPGGETVDFLYRPNAGISAVKIKGSLQP